MYVLVMSIGNQKFGIPRKYQYQIGIWYFCPKFLGIFLVFYRYFEEVLPKIWLNIGIIGRTKIGLVFGFDLGHVCMYVCTPFSGQFRRQCMHFGNSAGNFGGLAIRRPVGHGSAAAMSKLVALLPNYMQIVQNWSEKGVYMWV